MLDNRGGIILDLFFIQKVWVLCFHHQTPQILELKSQKWCNLLTASWFCWKTWNLAVFLPVNGLLICAGLPSLIIQLTLNLSDIVLCYFVFYLIFILIEVVELDSEYCLIPLWATEFLDWGMTEVTISKGKLCCFSFFKSRGVESEKRSLLSCIFFYWGVISLRVDRSFVVCSCMIGWMITKGRCTFTSATLKTVRWFCFLQSI